VTTECAAKLQIGIFEFQAAGLRIMCSVNEFRRYLME
jgi:hypothetical protein